MITEKLCCSLLKHTQEPLGWHQMAVSWCAVGQGTERAGPRWFSAAPASFPGAAQSAASSARTQSPFTPVESKRAETKWSEQKDPNKPLDRHS